MQNENFTREWRTLPRILHLAQKRLDLVVAAAYGWDWLLGKNELPAKLLALNLEWGRAERPS